MKTNHVHLIEKQRDQIEIMLNENKNLKCIAEALGRDPRGIAYEIKSHRKVYNNGNKKNICGKQIECSQMHLCDACQFGKCKECRYGNCNNLCDHFTPYPTCKTCNRYPYVCNACDKKKDCKSPKYYYKAHVAHLEYKDNVSLWKEGPKLDGVNLKELDKIIKDGVDRNISIEVIIATNQLTISPSTVYRFIDQGLLSVKNIDLKRQVRYKSRRNIKKTREKPINYSYLEGRTFNDYAEYISHHPSTNVWQMDTVEGIKGGSSVLTLHHVKSNLQLYFKINSTCSSEVLRVFNGIKKHLGDQIFKEVFDCFLTDNGKEFRDPISIITNCETGEILSNIFYCEPRRSDQKGACEKNHEHFRECIPKGIDIKLYSHTQINYISNNVNNYPRKSLNYKSPYQVFEALGIHKKTFELNKLKMLPASKVTLKRI